MDEENEIGKSAVVFNDNKAVRKNFDNFSAKGIDKKPIIDERIEGCVLAFNVFEEILLNADSSRGKIKDLIHGLTSEITLAVIGGCRIMYYTSFKKYKEYGEDDLPKYFSTSEDDLYYNRATRKDMIKYIHSLFPTLKTIRLIGIISKNELNEFVEEFSEVENFEIDIESPYLIVVD